MATLPNAPCCQHRQETIIEMQRSDLQEMLATAVRELRDALGWRFADWPDGRVARRAAGVYTIWRQENLLYTGMSGRGARVEDFTGGSDGKSVGFWRRC